MNGVAVLGFLGPAKRSKAVLESTLARDSRMARPLVVWPTGSSEPAGRSGACAERPKRASHASENSKAEGLAEGLFGWSWVQLASERLEHALPRARAVDQFDPADDPIEDAEEV